MRIGLCVAACGGLVLCVLTFASVALVGFSVFTAAGALFFGTSTAICFYELRKRRATDVGPFPSVSHGTLPGLQRFASPDAGILFPAPRGSGIVLTLIGTASVGAAGWSLVVLPNVAPLRDTTFLLLDPPTAICVALLGIMLVGIGGITLIRRDGVVLTPTGVFVRAADQQKWVPWDALAHVRTTTAPIPNMPRELSINQALVLVAHHPNAIAATGALGSWDLGSLLPRTLCGDVMVTESQVRAPAEHIARQIHYYWATPRHRAFLADPNFALGDGHALP